ncbi:MAG: 3-oxoacyl-[acyl-carrier-protein] reductase [Deltaproteobacteria bacterium]|nr:3-oxoacyl-[acyl-carrier-protein] reductase [Deltaproteobacteria bacterium]
MLNEQVAVVTGGSRGIGKEICKKLASLGAHVFVNYNSSASGAEETAAECKQLGGNADIIGFNVADSDAVSEAFETIKKQTGRIDILVNNAGISKDGLFVRIKDEDWAQTVQTNLSGAFYCARAAAKVMMKARSGKIVNISSITAEMGNPGQVPYISSKAGLFGMTKALAKELASRNINVNCITPGFIETEMTGNLPEETQIEYKKAIPLGRFGEAKEVAELVAFLSSPASAYITGQVIGINGGMYM